MRRALPLGVMLAPALFLPAAPTPNPAPPDWPMFGGTPARNMVSRSAAGLSPEFPRVREGTGHPVWVLGDRVKWKATLGSRAYGGPTVVGDRILVGTNNENPRNKR